MFCVHLRANKDFILFLLNEEARLVRSSVRLIVRKLIAQKIVAIKRKASNILYYYLFMHTTANEKQNNAESHFPSFAIVLHFFFCV